MKIIDLMPVYRLQKRGPAFNDASLEIKLDDFILKNT